MGVSTRVSATSAAEPEDRDGTHEHRAAQGSASNNFPTLKCRPLACTGKSFAVKSGTAGVVLTAGAESVSSSSRLCTEMSGRSNGSVTEFGL